MAKRMFEFVCEEGHLAEKLISDDVRETECKVCGNKSFRIMSKPMIKLEGVSGDFPGAYYSWEAKRAKQIAQERKQSAAD